MTSPTGEPPSSPAERTTPDGPAATRPAPAERTTRPRPTAPAEPATQLRPAAAAAPAEPTTEPAAPAPAPAPAAPAAPSRKEPEASAATTRPGTAPSSEPAPRPETAPRPDATTRPTPGTPARPSGPIAPAAATAAAGAAALGGGEPAPDPKPRGRRARNLLRFTAPKRPEQTEREAAVPDAPAPLADFDRLTQSIESVTEALGGQPLEFYERDLPQIAAAETARRVRADVVVLLLDNGEGIMEVSGGVGLTPAERRLSVEYSRDVMRELFRAGVGLIEDTDRVRGALAGIPGSRAETLVMVPLVHERLGFGVLMAGRNRSQTGVPTEVFSDAEIEVLMGFADAAAASLRTAVLLRHLKGQLRALEEDD
jgi:hypothetical protein